MKDLEGLAKLSEEENYLKRNRYMLELTKLDYSDKKRQPVDINKLVEVLRFQGEFRKKLDDDRVGIHPRADEIPEGSNSKLLSYINSVATGDLRFLLDDIGINSESLVYMNPRDQDNLQDNLGLSNQ